MEKLQKHIFFASIALFVCIFALGFLNLTQKTNHKHNLVQAAQAQADDASTDASSKTKTCDPSKSNQCSKGDYCQKGTKQSTCQPQKSAGQKCTPNNNECGSGLSCSKNSSGVDVCQKGSSKTKTCDPSKSNQCSSGQYCQKGTKQSTCEDQKSLNDKCTPNNNECSSHLFCDSSKNTCRGGAQYVCDPKKNECGTGYNCAKSSSSKKFVCQKTVTTKKTLNQKCTVGANECDAKLFCDPSSKSSKTGTCRGQTGYVCSSQKNECGTGYKCTTTSGSKTTTCQPTSTKPVGKCGTCTPGAKNTCTEGLICNADTHTCQQPVGKHGSSCDLSSPSCNACQKNLDCIGDDGSQTSSGKGTCQNFTTCKDNTTICGEGYKCQLNSDTKNYECVTTVANNVVTSVAVNLQGIGIGPQTGQGYKINNSPQTPHRDLTVYLYKSGVNPKEKPNYTKTDQVNFEFNSGEFDNLVFKLGNVPNGTYSAFVQTDGYLRKSIGQISITLGNITNLTPIVPTLLAGDLDGDNQVNVLDYNSIITCFPQGGQTDTSGINQTSNCSPNADLNDNGNPNDNDWNDDLNLLLTNFGKNGD